MTAHDDAPDPAKKKTGRPGPPVGHRCGMDAAARRGEADGEVVT